MADILSSVMITVILILMLSVMYTKYLGRDVVLLAAM